MKKNLLLFVFACLFILNIKAQIISTTLTYTCTGVTQTFVVPNCVDTISVEAWGAGGGGGGGDTYGGGNGGGGAYSSSLISVTPGQTLTVVVGCGGLPGGSCQAAGGFGAGGFGLGTGGNGGNPGGSGCSGPAGGGGGGTGLENGNTILLVAGGGGGAGGGGNHSPGADGGGGGVDGSPTTSGPAGLIGASGSTIGLNGANSTGNGGGGGGAGGGFIGGGGGAGSAIDNGGTGGAGGTSLGSAVNGNGQNPGNSASSNLCVGCAIGGSGSAPADSGVAGGNGILIIHYNTTNCNTTNISQLTTEKEKIIVYPNPANNNITIQSSTKLGTITIYNYLGETIMHTKSLNNNEQIDISKYESGVYTIQIQNKIIKFLKE